MATIPTSRTIISQIAEQFYRYGYHDSVNPNVVYMGDEQFKRLIAEIHVLKLLNVDQIEAMRTTEEPLDVSGIQIVRVRIKDHLHVTYTSWLPDNPSEWLTS